MKVLHILDQVNRGGTETLVLDICRNAKINNLDLVFITCGKGDLFDEFKNSGVKFYYLPRKYPLDLNVIKELRKIIKEEEIKIIHTHVDVSLVHAILSSLGTKCKVVQTIHGFSDRKSPKGKFDLRCYLIHLIGSYILPVTFTVSDYLRNELIKQGFNKNRLKMLYNGIDFNKYQGCQAKKNRNENLFVFGMVGNFNHVRNHRVLLEAFKKLIDEGYNVYLKLAGKGELLESMQKYALTLGIKDKVEFLGSVSDISKFLSEIDCFVYSSRSDTFGLAVVEALYAGLPVIVSNNGPFPEITNNGKYAILFEANNVNSLYIKMKEIIANNNEYDIIKLDKIREIINNSFSINNHIKQLKLEYSKIFY